MGPVIGEAFKFRTCVRREAFSDVMGEGKGGVGTSSLGYQAQLLSSNISHTSRALINDHPL